MSDKHRVSAMSENQLPERCQILDRELHTMTALAHQSKYLERQGINKARLHPAPRWVDVSTSIESLTRSISTLSLSPGYFRLLDLPGEVRNCIYRFAVDQGPPPTPKELDDLELKLMSNSSCYEAWKKKQHCFNYKLFQPNITRVSKRLRSESLPMFYSENIFCFEMDTMRLPSFDKWSRHTSAVNMTHLSALCIALLALVPPDDSGSREHAYAEDVNFYIKLSTDRTAFSLHSSSLLAHFSQNALACAAIDVLGAKSKLSGLDLIVFASALLSSYRCLYLVIALRDKKDKEDYPTERHSTAEDLHDPSMSGNKCRVL